MFTFPHRRVFTPFYFTALLWLGPAPLAVVHASDTGHAPTKHCPAALDVEVRRLNSDDTVHLCEEYGGSVVLIVNTASKCGFTHQYEGLENLYSRYKDQGLVVLGFPSNDFAGQEPGNEQEIQTFCRLTYSVEFPMFQKSHVSQGRADPLYQGLARRAGEYPRWNFHKYLLDRHGRLVASFSTQTPPESEEIVGAIEQLL